MATSLVLEFDNSDKLENERKARDEWLRDTISTLATFTVIGLIAVAGWQLVLLNKFFRWVSLSHSLCIWLSCLSPLPFFVFYLVFYKLLLT